MYTILIIEDDEILRQEVSVLLQNQQYQTSIWDMQKDLKDVLQEQVIHLVLLDIKLPKQSGLQICTYLRTFSKVPILFVTSCDSEMDELCAMNLGGDGYIRKPYHPAILLAHIHALLQRSYPDVQTVLAYKGMSLDIARSELHYKEQQIALTKSELRILYCLFSQPGNIVSREVLIDDLWDHKMFIDDNMLSVHMTRLRTKLRSIGLADVIVTRHRQGYQI